MDKQELQGIIYRNLYAFKYMLENNGYTFNEYVNTVAAEASRDIKNKDDATIDREISER